MSFESHIADHLKTLEDRKRRYEFDQRSMIHDCDCEYCEVAGDIPDENQEEYEKLGEKIAKTEQLIKRLKAHAKLHKIEVAE